MVTKRVDTQDARAALASLTEKLKTHAELCDPADIAESAIQMMEEVECDLRSILVYLRAFETDAIGLDELSLRDLLLAGDTILVDFLTPDGPGRLAVAVDEDMPVSLSLAPDDAVRRWQDLHAA